MNVLEGDIITHGIKIAVLIISLFIALIIIVYNWLYMVRVFSSHEDTDLHPPKNIGRLIKASIFTALFTVVLIIFFFITNIY